MDELMRSDFMLFLFGTGIIVVAIFYLLSKGLPAGTKGITNEYTSKSGVKRTAKKEREDYIV